MKYITDTLKGIDFFGVKQGFRIKNKDAYGTVFGGVCFIIYLIGAILFLTYSVKVFLGKETFTIMVINKSISPAKRLNFTEQEFALSMKISFANGTSLENTRYKDLFIMQSKVVKVKDKGKKILNLPVHTCTKKDYYHLQNSSAFKRNPMNELTCFGDKDSLIVEGGKFESKNSYLEFDVGINPSTAKKYSDVFEAFNQNQFIFTMYYTRPMYDISNKLTPIYFELDSLYTYLDINSFKSNDVKFQEFIFSDDSNLLLDNYNSQVHMRLKDHHYHVVSVIDRQYSKLPSRLSLINYKLRASNIQHTVKRSFKKVTDFLAGLMALLFNCLIGVGVFVHVVNNFKARQSIIKRVMKYNDDLGMHPETQKTLKEIKDEYIDKQNTQEKSNSNKEVTALTVDPSNANDETEHLNKDNAAPTAHSKPPNKHTVNFCDFLSIIFCCQGKNKKDIYTKAEKKIFYNIDILTYIKKMQELEIIKYMLLGENTLKLVNFISKPGISYIDRGEENNPFFYNGQEFDVTPNYNKDLKEIKAVYKDIKANKEMTEAEKKIIKLFENQVSEIVTNSYEEQ